LQTVCSRIASGQPYCWGAGFIGQIGDGSFVSRSSPVAVSWPEGTAGTAVSLIVNGGNNQSATAGSATASSPSVLVRDYAGTPVAGVSVTFSVASGGGSLTSAT